MTPPPQPPHGLDLKAGTPVLILRAQLSGDEPLEAMPLTGPSIGIKACVERVDDELLWLVGTHAAFEPGERVWLDVSVERDARYRAAFEVEVASERHIALCARGKLVWQRVQQRALVRIDTPDLQVRIRRSRASELAPTATGATGATAATAATRSTRATGAAESSAAGGSGDEHAAGPPGETHRMVDLSAEGMRIIANADFEVDEDLICDFELPDHPPYSVTSRVVRIDPKRKFVSLKFTNASEAFFSEILRWIFREEVRQHRRSLKAGKDGKAGKDDA